MHFRWKTTALDLQMLAEARRSTEHTDVARSAILSSTWLAGVMALVTCATGCRLPFTEGPVSRSLVNCRQLSQKGVSALERGDSQTAESYLKEAVEVCEVDPEARRHYANALWQRGQRREALDQINEALRLSSDDDTLLVRAAEMRLALGEVENAQSFAGQALDLNPKSATAWALRGRVNLRAGQPRQALADLQRSLAFAPGNREVLMDLAETYRQLNEPQRALANLQALADSYPPGEEPQKVLHLEGLAMSALGRHDDAVECLATACSRDRPTPDLLVCLAEAELAAGHPADARGRVQQALLLDPRHSPSLALVERLDQLAARPATGAALR